MPTVGEVEALVARRARERLAGGGDVDAAKSLAHALNAGGSSALLRWSEFAPKIRPLAPGASEPPLIERDLRARSGAG